MGCGKQPGALQGFGKERAAALAAAVLPPGSSTCLPAHGAVPVAAPCSAGAARPSRSPEAVLDGDKDHALKNNRGFSPQSLKSRGYVKEQFAWRHFYWYLTNEGIQYLRDYLHLPPEIVPATLRRSRPETGRPRPKGLEGERPARLTRGEADRDTYRRSAVPPGADKKAEAGAGAATEFQFRGGFGRGRGQPPQ
ncbi:PREDICTED: 40S ribosomal protein S10 [Tinamus guttatus]|uniref:40S ribosomal protein S10 n=1 Tax=Tinamus guttatus TaxID=94827 RepID=UPI00052F1B51|nr:PREDICTED: 40S ribosomal protein S10 [Tinamus guttatus]